jgi:hypothetical protein
VLVYVAFVIQHAMRMRRNVVCGLPRSTIFFHINVINVTIFGKKKVNAKLYFRQLLSETFLILRRNVRDMITNVYWSSREVPFILSDFNET